MKNKRAKERRLSNRAGSKVGSKEFLLNLAILDLIREPGRSYTLAQLSAALGVSRATVYNIEYHALAKMKRFAAKQDRA